MIHVDHNKYQVKGTILLLVVSSVVYHNFLEVYIFFAENRV